MRTKVVNGMFEAAADTIIVPTRSLASYLLERHTKEQTQRGHSAWLVPRIGLWSDFVATRWSSIRFSKATPFKAAMLIGASQSLAVWKQVIRDEIEQDSRLAHVNADQLARSLQRSWHNQYQWLLSQSSTDADRSKNIYFKRWSERYSSRLRELGVIDQDLAADVVLKTASFEPLKCVQVHAFVQYTPWQMAMMAALREAGVELVESSPPTVNSKATVYRVYDSEEDELLRVLQNARQLLEDRPGVKIKLVVPNLKERQLEVKRVARQVFYPQRLPLAPHPVYHLSLGTALADWPAIHTALAVLDCLRNRIERDEFLSLLHSDLLAPARVAKEASLAFDHWLRLQPIESLGIKELGHLLQRFMQDNDMATEDEQITKIGSFFAALTEQSEQLVGGGANAFKTPQQWTNVFDQYLSLWQWQLQLDPPIKSGDDNNGEELEQTYRQLKRKWNQLLQEFSGFAVVENKIHLNAALELLNELCRNTIFQAKAADMPIFICGLAEAIGRTADVCFIIGLNETQPATVAADRFLPRDLLFAAGHPAVDVAYHLEHFAQQLKSVQASAAACVLSYARQRPDNPDVRLSCCSLFSQTEFQQVAPTGINEPDDAAIEVYADDQLALAKSTTASKRLSTVIEQQSQCPFKAVLRFRIGYEAYEESEFGLDARDRGLLLHRLMEAIWSQLENHDVLMRMTPSDEQQMLKQIVDRLLDQELQFLSAEKQHLCRLERQRLIALAAKWLLLERNRPLGFGVKKTEWRVQQQLSGFAFNVVLDRLDELEDGSLYIIDYKSGNASRGDWFGERLLRPQLPLYALLLLERQMQITGIAYARLKAGEMEWLGLGVAGIFREIDRHERQREQQWFDQIEVWRQQINELLADYQAGVATVTPINDNICTYCEARQVCRTLQLSDSLK